MLLHPDLDDSRKIAVMEAFIQHLTKRVDKIEDVLETVVKDLRSEVRAAREEASRANALLGSKIDALRLAKAKAEGAINAGSWVVKAAWALGGALVPMVVWLSGLK